MTDNYLVEVESFKADLDSVLEQMDRDKAIKSLAPLFYLILNTKLI